MLHEHRGLHTPQRVRCRAPSLRRGCRVLHECHLPKGHPSPSRLVSTVGRRSGVPSSRGFQSASFFIILRSWGINYSRSIGNHWRLIMPFIGPTSYLLDEGRRAPRAAQWFTTIGVVVSRQIVDCRLRP